MEDLAGSVTETAGQPATVRVGTVVATTPELVVEVQGSRLLPEAVGILGAYVPAVGDTVAVLGQSVEGAGSSGSSWLVLGHASPSIYGQTMIDLNVSSGDFVQAAGGNGIVVQGSFTAVAGARYEAYFETIYQFSVGNGSLVHLRHGAGTAVTVSSALVGTRLLTPISTAHPAQVVFSRTFTALASGAYAVGISSNFFGGAGNLTFSANGNSTMVLRVKRIP